MQFGVGYLAITRKPNHDLATAKKRMAGARQDVVRGFPRTRKFSMPRSEKGAMLIRRRRELFFIYYKGILNN